MILFRKLQIVSAAIAATLAGSALAAVSAEEAAQLGGPVLTAFGAEKAGNTEGTIPAYDGKGIAPPADWDPKEPGRRPDPFHEKPLFSITAQNAAQYVDKLTEFQKEMFKRYPNYRMDIYPTHRTMVYPKHILDATLKNATLCKGLDNELRLEGCYGGMPFPIPKTGNQVMWNHLMFYGGTTIAENTRHWQVPASGNAFLVAASRTHESFPMFEEKNAGKVMEGKDSYYRIRLDDYAPARTAGQKLLLIDALDQYRIGRRAYQYLPGQRRVKLSPDLAYDTPAPYNGGIGTLDDAKLFLGALDRFDFKLIGKAEKFLAYNTYPSQDYKTCPEEKLMATKNFPNPDCSRWELHRVWIVESTLKPEFRHIYKKRVFYFDEDGYGAGFQESYDASGKLFRGAYNNFYTFWEKDGGNNGSVVIMDVTTGGYVMQGTGAAPKAGYWPVADKPDTFYSPEALAGEGIR